MRKIAISDIHGCNKTFNKLLEKINFSKEDELLLGGDYIDRGPDSKGVIDTIMSLIESGHKLRCLKGNHESLMEFSLYDREANKNWLMFGGKQTIKSFKTRKLQNIADKYWDFLESLEMYISEEDFIFVHAGINFKNVDPFMDLDALLWSRGWYNEINYDWLGDRIIIHGHTPNSENSIRFALEHLDVNRVINIDCGCFSKIESGKGRLCAFDLTNRELYFQKNLDNMRSWFS